MILTRQTKVLLGLVASLTLLNFFHPTQSKQRHSPLPELSALSKDTLERIEITTRMEKTVLVKRSDGWHVTAPFQARADQALITSLILTFRKANTVDVRVDSDDYEIYGLTGSDGIVAEFWVDQEEPALSFTVGNDAPGGSSFIRLSENNAVYRARVGGRHRYDMPSIAWRNRVILDFKSSEVVSLNIQDGPTFVRKDSQEADQSVTSGAWRLDPDPGWAVDEHAVETMVAMLGGLRAGGLLGNDFNGGFSPPRATLEVTLEGGQTRSLRIGSRQQDSATFVQTNEDSEVFQVSNQAINHILKPTSAYRDRTVMRLDRGLIDTVELNRTNLTVLLQQDPNSALWTILQPANIDIDPRRVATMVNTLCTLQAHALVEGRNTPLQTSQPTEQVTVHLLDGQQISMELGGEHPEFPGSIYGRRMDTGQQFILDSETHRTLLAGFGE